MLIFYQGWCTKKRTQKAKMHPVSTGCTNNDIYNNRMESESTIIYLTNSTRITIIFYHFMMIFTSKKAPRPLSPSAHNSIILLCNPYHCTLFHFYLNRAELSELFFTIPYISKWIPLFEFLYIIFPFFFVMRYIKE